jgi:hypothetical protein
MSDADDGTDSGAADYLRSHLGTLNRQARYLERIHDLEPESSQELVSELGVILMRDWDEITPRCGDWSRRPAC